MICSNKSVWDISTTMRLKITQKQNSEHSTRESERVWSLFWRLLSTGRINVVDLNKTPDGQLDPHEHFTSEGSGEVRFFRVCFSHTHKEQQQLIYIYCAELPTQLERAVHAQRCCFVLSVDSPSKSVEDLRADIYQRKGFFFRRWRLKAEIRMDLHFFGWTVPLRIWRHLWGCWVTGSHVTVVSV